MGLQAGNPNNVEVGLKSAGCGLSSLSGLCGPGAGGKFKGSLFYRKSGWELSQVTSAPKEWFVWVVPVQGLSIKLQLT